MSSALNRVFENVPEWPIPAWVMTFVSRTAAEIEAEKQEMRELGVSIGEYYRGHASGGTPIYRVKPEAEK